MSGNFVRDVVAARRIDEPAVITLAINGARRQRTYGELVAASGGLAERFTSCGVSRGSTVLTLVGSRIEYVPAILAGWFVDELPKTTSGKLRRAALRPPLGLAP